MINSHCIWSKLSLEGGLRAKSSVPYGVARPCDALEKSQGDFKTHSALAERSLTKDSYDN